MFMKKPKREYTIFMTYMIMLFALFQCKDSGVLINIAWEVAQERGLDKVDVIFRDEELVPQETDAR